MTNTGMVKKASCLHGRAGNELIGLGGDGSYSLAVVEFARIPFTQGILVNPTSVDSHQPLVLFVVSLNWFGSCVR